ncbi:MAG TPA: tetratricopeptide repeat protein [Bellilinea sp.]|nr:tetratricopeptide repeat protein [Bellilinea sp.]
MDKKIKSINDLNRGATSGDDLLDWVSLVVVGIVVTLAYLPALTSGFLSLDDIALVKTFMTSEISLKSLFVGASGDYFRPITILSYFLDVKAGDADPLISHILNVGLHLSNTFLVFVLSRAYLNKVTDSRWPSLAAALIFGLSPLNTESVVWVSGRTDLLCCFFFLLSLNLIIAKNTFPQLLTAGAISICFLCSLLAKESSIALLGIVPFFLWSGQNSGMGSRRFLVLIAMGSALAAYLILRFGIDFSVDNGVAKVVQGGKAKSFSMLLYESIAAMGFYFRKLLWPFPLNFAIVSINRPLSAVIAFAGIFSLSCLYLRVAITRLPILIMVMCIIPPIMAIHGKLAWTPYAERYLYLPMVGFAMFVGWAVTQLPKRLASFAVIALLLLAFPTLSRAVIWSNPEVFWRETIEKSPEFPRSYVGYAAELIKLRRYDEAEQNLKRALDMKYETYFVWQNLATIYQERGDHSQYENAMLRAISLSKTPTELYIKLIQNLLWHGTKSENSRKAYQKAANYYLLAYEKDKNFGEGLYNAAKLYLILGDQRKARCYFELFLANPGDSLYRPAARKMLDKIVTHDNLGGAAI